MNFEDKYPNRGSLTVTVTAASRAIPVKGAKVTVSRTTSAGEEIIKTMLTDANGNTEHISLPAPSAQNSLSPGNSDLYSKYNVRVEYDGYYTVENRGVPVFAGRTSIQPVALQPLPLGAVEPEVLDFEEREPDDLSGDSASDDLPNETEGERK